MFKRALLILVATLFMFLTPQNVVLANSLTDGDVTDIYQVYLTDGTKLFERTDVEVGDIYINTDFYEFVVIEVNDNTKTAIAKFSRAIKPPKVDFNYLNPTPIDTSNKVIAMYSTHNDESYVTGDGYDSVYGAGGIHDVAKKLKNAFISKGINCVYDETLHIPHDTSAYSRSNLTAKKLIESYSPNAIFDIHRDGASRKTYVSTYNGEEVCKVRIVIGKGNRNYQVNQEFALYLLSVAKELYPWLFLDIYFGSGHYNQALSNKAILFEMGSHLVEKGLVLKSVEPLAEVINIALFGTTINDEGDAIIGGNSVSNPTIDEYFKDENMPSKNSSGIIVTIIVISIFIISGVILAVYFTLKNNNLKNTKK